jgi:hypothetical protein
MQSFIVIFLVFLFIGSVQSQNWLGTYTPDTSCSTASCCCLSGQIVVSTPSTGFSSFTTGLSGGALCGGYPAYTTNMSTPTGYVATLTISSITLTFTLDSSSSFINVSSTQSGFTCDSFLTKSITATTTGIGTTAATTAGTGTTAATTAGTGTTAATTAGNGTTAATTTAIATSKSVGLINTMPPSKSGLLYLMTFIGLMKSVWSM